MKRNDYNSLAALPNEEGFRFLGVMDDGEQRQCIVKKTDEGSFYVGGDAEFEQLVGWLRVLQ